MRLTQRTGELVIRHGKGDRRRIVPLNRPARAALREWLADRAAPPQPAEHHERPAVDLADRRAAVGALDQQDRHRGDGPAGIEESAHALRHTVATRLVRDHGHDLVLVADILGHADVKTTRRYARSDLEQRRAALEDLAD